MKQGETLRKREALLARLPLTGEIVRGALLERRLRPHGARCAKCASGEGHRLWALTVSYPGGRTRQISLRGAQVAAVRRWLGNYQALKDASEGICELNHALLRPEPEAPQPRRRAGSRRGAPGAASATG
jgi:hypothetical protein